MYQLTHNISIKDKNTFGIAAQVSHYLTIDSAQDLVHFFKENNPEKHLKRLFLGEGSNMLFVSDFDGLVIHPQIQSIQLITNEESFIEIEVGAGVKWDYFVNYCVEHGWGGIENLSLIPGNVGAVPVQNIGAYGVEVESVITSVNGIDLNTLENKSFTHKECNFGYRTSIFKEQLKEQFMVTSVVFRLFKQPIFHLDYGALEAEVSRIGEINLQNIRKAVISIRESKLPDPSVIGNAGSFFKNPVLSEAKAILLKDSYPDVPIYPFGLGRVKLAAGWLIEKSGWKGRSFGNAAVHDKQALVLINNGDATGMEIFGLSELIIKDVSRKFNIELEREVQVIGK